MNIQKTGFRRNIIKAMNNGVNARDHKFAIEDINDEFQRSKVLPVGYSIDEENQIIKVYDVAHKLSPIKLEKYGNIYNALDSNLDDDFNWSIELHICTVNGNEIGAIELLRVFFDSCGM